MQFPETPLKAALLTRQWDELMVEYGRLDAVGEFDFAMQKQVLSVAFIPHEQVTWSFGGQPQTTAMPVGSVFLYGDQEFVWHQRSRPSEYVNLILSPTLLQRLADEHGFSGSPELTPQVLFQDPTILSVAQLLKAEVVSGGFAGTVYVESLRNLLAVHLLRHHTCQLVKPTIAPSLLAGLQLKRLKDYIEEHLAEELTIATLAELVPMSQFHFARAFKAVVGEPPHRYITQRRIERAKVLLTATQLSAAEIAYQVGFANQSHFTAQFRRLVGITPKQFRLCA